MATDGRLEVLLDTSVLLNFLRVTRLDLLADELGDHVKLTVNPSVQPQVVLRWRDEDTCDKRSVLGQTILEAVGNAWKEIKQ